MGRAGPNWFGCRTPSASAEPQGGSTTDGAIPLCSSHPGRPNRPPRDRWPRHGLVLRAGRGHPPGMSLPTLISALANVVISEEATFSWGVVAVIAGLSGFLAEARYQVGELRKKDAANEVKLASLLSARDALEKDVAALNEWRREAKTRLENLQANDAAMDGRLIRVETTVGAIHDTVLKIDATLRTLVMSGSGVRQSA
jgi:hypothetical protein